MYMYMYMYVYMYMHVMYMCLYIVIRRMHTHMYTGMHDMYDLYDMYGMHACTYVYIYMYVCMHVRMHPQIYTSRQTCMCLHACLHLCTSTRPYVHKYMRLYSYLVLALISWSYRAHAADDWIVCVCVCLCRKTSAQALVQPVAAISRLQLIGVRWHPGDRTSWAQAGPSELGSPPRIRSRLSRVFIR